MAKGKHESQLAANHQEVAAVAAGRTTAMMATTPVCAGAA
jgi:hypothetical protein